MRILILLIGLLLPALPGACQRDYLRMPPVLPDTTAQEDTVWAETGAAADDPSDYYRGIAGFEQGYYLRAERAFRKAFNLHPNEEVAGYLYYALLYQGLDLQAAAFREQHPGYTYALPVPKRGLESVYANGGIRISARPAAASNIGYGDIGAYYRLSPSRRLWQSAAYLWQQENLGSFKQLEYHAALIAYVKRGWTITPAFNACYVPYTTRYATTDSVFYTAAFRAGHDTILYRTRGLQTTQLTIPGKAGFLNVSLPVTKRIGAFHLEAEPAVHYWPGSGRIHFEYATSGRTDSFEDNHYRGSRPYAQTGSGVRDTSYTYFAWQLGASVTWQPPFKRAPISLRATAYYLQDESGNSAFAWHLYALLWWHRDFRIFFSGLHKGDLPLSLYAEGRYLNFNDPVNIRAGATFQWHPLQRWSPAVSYQYEHNTRLQDGAALRYHSVYLSLKYNL